MSEDRSDREHWTRVAGDWIAWARRPNHDVFWAYRELLRAFIGEGSGRALDIGCGEGRVSRELKALGYHVTAADAVAEMVAAAQGLGSADRYIVAEAAAMPFADGEFDLVVSYNMLMDVDDVSGAAREMRRVLKPCGTVLVSIVHPFRDRGRFADQTPDAPFVLEGSYFGRVPFAVTVERDGMPMHFAGWSQPLEAYAGALEAAGLAITSLREPLPLGGNPQDSRVPLFLWLKARPLA